MRSSSSCGRRRSVALLICRHATPSSRYVVALSPVVVVAPSFCGRRRPAVVVAPSPCSSAVTLRRRHATSSPCCAVVSLLHRPAHLPVRPYHRPARCIVASLYCHRPAHLPAIRPYCRLAIWPYRHLAVLSPCSSAVSLLSGRPAYQATISCIAFSPLRHRLAL